MEDINAIDSDSMKQQKKLIRASKIALATYLLNPTGDNGQSASNIMQGFSKSSTSTGAGTSGALSAVK